MARKYEMKRRAEAQAETRGRIVEAAVELHRTIGPARTTVSAIAQRARVQRHTYYRYFPSERDLILACSGLDMERNPPPDAQPWAEIADPVERLRIGLDDLYSYYAANEAMLSNVTRDAEVHPETREVAAMRFGPTMAAMHAVLTSGMPASAVPLIGLALQFTTWRSLVRDSSLSQRAAVKTMVEAVEAARATDAQRTRRRRRSAAPRQASAPRKPAPR